MLFRSEEAATIDGCGRYRTFFSIVFPLLKPITFTIVILNVLQFWNDYLLPSLVLAKREILTLPLTTYVFYGTYSAEYGVISQRDFFDHDISNAENIGGYYVVRNEDFVYNPRISVRQEIFDFRCRTYTE